MTTKFKLERIVQYKAGQAFEIAKDSYNMASIDIEKELQNWKSHVFQAHHYGSMSENEYKSVYNLLCVVQQKIKEMRIQ